MTATLIQATVITVSNRCARGEAEDLSGQVLREALNAQNYQVDSQIIPDGVESVSTAISAAVNSGSRVVITTGGTGVTPLDLTPEGTSRLLERKLPGIADAIRRKGAEVVPTAVLSRGLAGTIGTSFICNLPGSPGGARDGIAVLAPLLDHILDQLLGGNHE